jgi:hypothetical protein
MRPPTKHVPWATPSITPWNVGGALGPVLALQVRENLGIEYVLIMSSVTSFALFLGTLLFFDEPFREEKRAVRTMSGVLRDMLLVFTNFRFMLPKNCTGVANLRPVRRATDAVTCAQNAGSVRDVRGLPRSLRRSCPRAPTGLDLREWARRAQRDRPKRTLAEKQPRPEPGDVSRAGSHQLVQVMARDRIFEKKSETFCLGTL